MCSETFLRLPEEKKNRFLDAAWEEFTKVPFTEASINKIILRARIPRGSFYQYFADKEELFFYLLGGMLESSLAEYNQVLLRYQGDIFQTQLHCFDRVLIERNLNPLFCKGVEVLHLNPMFFVENIVKKEMAYSVWEAARGNIDHRMFHDTETEKQIFVMSLIALVMTMSQAMMNPERIEQCRQDLILRLDILKNGSLAAVPEKEAL